MAMATPLDWPMTASARVGHLAAAAQADRHQLQLTGSDIAMRLRIAGIIVLRYAQPLTRVVRLTIDDVLLDGETTLLRPGEPASPVRAPVASLPAD
jgi:hypothetical protein